MTRVRTPIYWTLVGAVTVWLGLIFLAPYARQEGWLVTPFLYKFFHQVCHQISDRSFHAFGHPLAVCHRCLGLYVGGLSGLLVFPSLHRLREGLLGRPRLVLLFFAPLLVDVALIGTNTYVTRFVTGVIAAFPVGLLAWIAAQQVFGVQDRPNRTVASVLTNAGGRE